MNSIQKLYSELQKANESLRLCEKTIENLERSNHALSQALQVFVPILHEDLTTHTRAELKRALKLIEPMEKEAQRIRELLEAAK